MNNKGFAISGILYTLFVLFLVILVLALDGLKTRNNYLEKSITVSGLNEVYIGKWLEFYSTDYETSLEFPYTGKYSFSVTLDDGSTVNCYSYLTKGAVISNEDGTINYDNIKYTTSTCNDIADKSGFILKGVYQFGESEERE